MKRITIIMILLAAGLTFTFGQAVTDSLSMEKEIGGYQFYQGDKRLNLNQLVEIMKTDQEAYYQIILAQPTYRLATIIGGAGGFMVGWTIGTAIVREKPTWVLAGIGTGLIALSIPITKSFNKKAKQAIDTFNGKPQSSSFWDKSELNFSMTDNGVGLILTF